jgi:uncharacterized protein
MFADAPLWFLILVLITSFASGVTAAIVGFGIGSLLTPVIATHFGTDAAIAAVALPHLAGSLLRGWRLRRSIGWSIVLRFGILSAAGGLVGAFFFARLTPMVLTRTLGALLVLTAIAGLTGWTERWKPRSALAWILGALSGFLGGIVGNQGGLRAAGLSTFGLTPTSFVATSTIIGVLVDVVRTPVYLQGAGQRLAGLWGFVAIATAGVLAGTLVGQRLLFGLSTARFRVAVAAAIGLLGLWFLLGPV